MNKFSKLKLNVMYHRTLFIVMLPVALPVVQIKSGFFNLRKYFLQHVT